ncbi:unnamed protein product [Rhizoctonia solani]|uniref:Uncharacterized protein n=1 Tax=Rhizoctonia solani TaxID=456999 RepID=A0A8H2ZZR3_9AGAM|nr:unnamed protein product [Rhizoctonia solani]
MPSDSSQLGGETGSNTTATFEPGYRYMPYERIAGKSAADILKQVDKILQSSNIVLENHKDYLPSGQFAALKKAYCRYHWQMTNESQEDRAYYDKRIRESRILSQLYANRQTHQDRARVLLYKVENFQTKVLSASRNTHSKDALVLFEDELTDSPAPPRTSTLDSFTSWFSFGRTSSPTSEETSKAQPDLPLNVEAEEGFIVSVTHFPNPPGESGNNSEAEFGSRDVVGTGSQIYRRMIAFENKDKRIEIIGQLTPFYVSCIFLTLGACFSPDQKLYALETTQTYIAENALQAMSELGQDLLNQSDSGIPSGSQITADAPSQTQSLETTIQKFKKMTVAKE